MASISGYAAGSKGRNKIGVCFISGGIDNNVALMVTLEHYSSQISIMAC
jgi:hypothetical protein